MSSSRRIEQEWVWQRRNLLICRWMKWRRYLKIGNIWITKLTARECQSWLKSRCGAFQLCECSEHRLSELMIFELSFSKFLIRSQSTIAFAMDLHNNSRIPARIDLRRLKTMPKVRNQGLFNWNNMYVYDRKRFSGTTCNGGYAFAAIGEYDNFSAKSNSVQYLLCDKHNFHCEGGDVFKARQYDIV